MGYHEIDLKLSSRSVFQEDVFYSIIQEGMVILCCLLIGLVSLGIGFATPSRLMLTFGLLEGGGLVAFVGYAGRTGQLPDN